MSFLKRALIATASAAAMMTSVMANQEARRAKEREPFAPTDRKPQFKRKRLKASPIRAKNRLNARAAYERQLRKEREIGVDPIFAHSAEAYRRPSREALSRQWKQISRAWDQKHG